MSNDPNHFFDKLDHTVTNRMLGNRHSVLKHIVQNSPIAQSQIRKDLGLKASSLRDILRDLEIARLIECTVIIDENNRPQKIIRVPDSLTMNKEDLG